MSHDSEYMRLARDIRQAWNDGLFACSTHQWERVRAEEKIQWIADCAPHHGATFDAFVAAARIVLDLPERYQWSGDDQWHLRRQFQQGQNDFYREQQQAQEADMRGDAMNDLKRLFAEQREEARAGVADGLLFGGSFRQIMQEAAAYGVKPEEVETIRDEVGKEHENEGHER